MIYILAAQRRGRNRGNWMDEAGVPGSYNKPERQWSTGANTNWQEVFQRSPHVSQLFLKVKLVTTMLIK